MVSHCFSSSSSSSRAMCALVLALSILAVQVSETQALAEGVELPGVLLRDWPMLTTHNAATGYMNSSTAFLLPNSDSTLAGIVSSASNPGQLLTNVAKNQIGSFSEQLDCGARALIVRPQVYNDNLIMHHGDVGINVSLADALEDVISWSAENQGELVILGMLYCDGTDCTDTMLDVLSNINITYLDDCSKLVNMTVTEARQLGELVEGGSVLAIAQECFDQNYDDSILCRISGGLACTSSSFTSEPFLALTSYLRNVTNTSAVDYRDDLLIFQNGHWQYDVSNAITLYILGSSLLEDSNDSNVNSFVAGLVSSGVLESIKMLQVDNVCGSGGSTLSRSVQVYSAEQSYRTAVPEETTAPTPSPASQRCSPSNILLALAILSVVKNMLM